MEIFQFAKFQRNLYNFCEPIDINRINNLPPADSSLAGYFQLRKESVAIHYRSAIVFLETECFWTCNLIRVKDNTDGRRHIRELKFFSMHFRLPIQYPTSTSVPSNLLSSKSYIIVLQELHYTLHA